MSDPVILALVAILLLFTAVTARRAAVPSRRGGRRSTRSPYASPVFATTGRTNPHRHSNHNTKQSQTPSRYAQRPAGSPRVIRGSDYLQNGRWRHLESFRVGREGEDLIAKQIEAQLDGHWTMFRNLDLLDKKGDIDVVLVGPAGIYALEVKTYTGNYRVEKGRYYKQTRSGHMAPMQYGPGAQAQNGARRLNNYLKLHGIVRRNFVEAVVVLARDVSIEIVTTATVIWTQDDIDRRLAELRSRIYLSPDHAERIVRVLDGVASSTTSTLH